MIKTIKTTLTFDKSNTDDMNLLNKLIEIYRNDTDWIFKDGDKKCSLTKSQLTYFDGRPRE